MTKKSERCSHASDEFGLPNEFYKNQVNESTGSIDLNIELPDDAVFAAQPVEPITFLGGAEGQDVITFSTEASKSFTVTDDTYRPDYYTAGKIEVWDFIADQKLDFFAGNVVKYVSRAGRKSGESRQKDLQKAKTYIQKMIDLSA